MRYSPETKSDPMSEPTTNCASGRCGESDKPCKHIWAAGACVECGVEWRVWAKRRIQELESQFAEKIKALAVCNTALEDISRDAWYDAGARGRIIATTADGALATIAALRKEGEKG